MVEQGPYKTIIGGDFYGRTGTLQYPSMVKHGPYNTIIGGDFYGRTGTLQYNNRR